MRVVILATEASGDFLGAELIKALKKKNKKIEICGIGGEKMAREGFTSWISIKKFNAIGIYEVLIRLFKFIKIIVFIKNKIINYSPDLIITIDSPSFSYRIIKKIQILRNHTKFIHYVAPSVWAWKSYRAKLFSKLYDRMFTLFDFEPKYFTKYGLNTKFVGHPIFFKKEKQFKKKKLIIFLPGSRTVEIKKNMEKLKFVIDRSEKIFNGFDLCILTFNQHKKLIKNYLSSTSINIETRDKEKKKIMKQAFLAVAASGSVTLELINYKTPMVVFYETHWITSRLIKFLVKVKFASIINIVFNKQIIPEFLFENFTTKNLINQMEQLINNDEERLKQLRYFRTFSTKMLCEKKNPSELIVQHLQI